MANTAQSMTTQTTSMTIGTTTRQLSQRALATRSLTAADRLSGDARREALTAHFQSFGQSQARTCSGPR